MSSVFDVAAYILRKCGPTSALKLQKLVYYSQAWHLVWEQVPLFDDPIEAWANGPVTPSLYRQHRGRWQIAFGEIAGDPDALAPNESESVDVVLDFYCRYTPRELSELTHREPPWLNAREGLSAGDRGAREIQLEDMLEYYSSLI